jgi:hypothetical protein
MVQNCLNAIQGVVTITAIPRLTKSQNINIILHYKCGSTGGTDLTKWYAAVNQYENNDIINQELAILSRQDNNYNWDFI